MLGTVGSIAEGGFRLSLIRSTNFIRRLPKNVCLAHYRNQLLCTTEKSITLQFMNVHRQVGYDGCGLYSLAYATALCNGMDPTACIFDHEEMRPHFFKCIMGSRVLTPFPILKQQRASPKPKKVELSCTLACTLHCGQEHFPSSFTKLSLTAHTHTVLCCHYLV